ncbi:hypothetical protein O3P69_013459 [Scylla paramamosain]|uniref:Uncharacterized protein n=1 Tax=Scylla paramamosain TaxID=85552 RepID=A0AAW0SAK4_SCYPA
MVTYGGGRSSQEYSCDRSSSWGAVTGEGADGEAMGGGDGAGEGRPLLRTSWRMDNLESEVALNILNAVVTNKEEAQWSRQRDWEGRQKRRMDWRSVVLPAWLANLNTGGGVFCGAAPRTERITAATNIMPVVVVVVVVLLLTPRVIE